MKSVWEKDKRCSRFRVAVGRGLLTIVIIGFIGLLVLAGLSLIYPLIGGIKANNGEPWAYPGSIRFF